MGIGMASSRVVGMMQFYGMAVGSPPDRGSWPFLWLRGLILASSAVIVSRFSRGRLQSEGLSLKET
jgi:hypothetical protein